MNWTTAPHLRQKALKLWQDGRLVAPPEKGGITFPLRLALKHPTPGEVAENFAQAQNWVGEVQRLAEKLGARVERKELGQRLIGTNPIPVALIFDSVHPLAVLADKVEALAWFQALAQEIGGRFPDLSPWVYQKPDQVIAHRADWPLVLDFLAWFSLHPHPGLFLRQVEIPGLSSKFIENHKALIRELLEILFPREIPAGGPPLNFEQRFGFKTKPILTRFRPHKNAQPWGQFSELTLTAGDFSNLGPRPPRVVIIENEISFLTFPANPDTLVIFGAGYGFEHIRQARWLLESPVYYWGDLDSHGLAILDQLRSHFPQAQSILMDRDTLWEHKDSWQTEESVPRTLSRLNEEENEVYQEIVARNLRLEQEHIRPSWIKYRLPQSLT